MKTHFEISHVAKYDSILSRDITSRQLKKVCYGCEKGFVKRKGRDKAFPVANQSNRWICQRCADSIIRGKSHEKLRLIDAE